MFVCCFVRSFFLLIVDRFEKTKNYCCCCFNEFDVSLSRFFFDLKKLKIVICFVLLFNKYNRNLFLLWFRLDLTRLIIVFIFYYFLKFQSFDKYEKKKRIQSLKWTKNNLSNNTISKKCIDQNVHVRIISFRKNVLYRYNYKIT